MKLPDTHILTFSSCRFLFGLLTSFLLTEFVSAEITILCIDKEGMPVEGAQAIIQKNETVSRIDGRLFWGMHPPKVHPISMESVTDNVIMPHVAFGNYSDENGTLVIKEHEENNFILVKKDEYIEHWLRNIKAGSISRLSFVSGVSTSLKVIGLPEIKKELRLSGIDSANSEKDYLYDSIIDSFEINNIQSGNYLGTLSFDRGKGVEQHLIDLELDSSTPLRQISLLSGSSTLEIHGFTPPQTKGYYLLESKTTRYKYKMSSDLMLIHNVLPSEYDIYAFVAPLNGFEYIKFHYGKVEIKDHSTKIIEWDFIPRELGEIILSFDDYEGERLLRIFRSDHMYASFRKLTVKNESSMVITNLPYGKYTISLETNNGQLTKDTELSKNGADIVEFKTKRYAKIMIKGELGENFKPIQLRWNYKKEGKTHYGYLPFESNKKSYEIGGVSSGKVEVSITAKNSTGAFVQFDYPIIITENTPYNITINTKIWKYRKIHILLNKDLSSFYVGCGKVTKKGKIRMNHKNLSGNVAKLAIPDGNWNISVYGKYQGKKVKCQKKIKVTASTSEILFDVK